MDKPQNFVKRTAVSQTKVKESLEIKNAKTKKRRKFLMPNEGNIDKSNMWAPLFAKLTEKKKRLDVKFRNGFISILCFNDV